LVQRIDINATTVDNYANVQLSAVVFNPSPQPQELSYTFAIPKKALVTAILMTVDNNKQIEEFKKEDSANYSDVVPKMTIAIKPASQEITLAAKSNGYGRISFSLNYEENLSVDGKGYQQKILFDSIEVSRFLKGKFAFNVTGKQTFQHLELTEIPAENIKIFPKSKSSILELELKSNIMEPRDQKDKFPTQIELIYSLSNPDVPYSVMGSKYYSHHFQPVFLFQKHIILVIDITDSMTLNSKLKHSKDAMYTIVASLTGNDYFSIITYSRRVNAWPSGRNVAHRGTEANKAAAINRIKDLTAGGQANINGVFDLVMEVATGFKTISTSDNFEQFVFFLSGGFPNNGAQPVTEILGNLMKIGHVIPIHSFAFGKDSDINLLQEISEATNGKSKQ